MLGTSSYIRLYNCYTWIASDEYPYDNWTMKWKEKNWIIIHVFVIKLHVTVLKENVNNNE